MQLQEMTPGVYSFLLNMSKYICCKDSLIHKNIFKNCIWGTSVVLSRTVKWEKCDAVTRGSQTMDAE